MARPKRPHSTDAYKNLLEDWKWVLDPKCDDDRLKELLLQEGRGLGLAARARLTALTYGSISRFEHDFGVSAEQLGEDEPHDRTLRIICGWLKDNRGIDAKAFRDTVFEGPDAVKECREWLRSGKLLIRTQLDLLPRTAFRSTPEREARLDETLAFIEQPTLRPIRTITGDGMSEGLRAFARRLFRRLERRGERRPMVYLPVSRDPRNNNKVSYPQLVGYLRAFYAREPIAQAQPPETADELRRDLETIRRGLSDQASIIVLDGWAAFSGGLPQLGSMMIDDGLWALLDEIIHPVRPPRAGEGDPLEFTRNRIIVLAATASQVSSPFAAPGVKSLPPPPEGLAMRQIARMQRRTPAFADLAADLTIDRTDVSLALIDFLTRTDPDGAPTPREDLLGGESALGPAVMARLRTKPLAFMIVVLAVLMPDGIRLETIRRIVRAWLATQALSPVTGPWPGATNATSAAEDGSGLSLEPLLDWLSPLLTEGLDVAIPGLDNQDYPRERLDFEAPATAGAPNYRYLDFAAPRLRSVFSPLLTGDNELQPAIARLHRLLAEDMLAQYNRIARHGDWREADLRFYRRLFQALFHGFNSLGRGPAWIDPGLKALPAAALPTDPVIAYLRLYAVHYRALLEAAPEWHLSRTLGADHVKVDLLKLMLNVDHDPPWENLRHRDQLKIRIPRFLTQASLTQPIGAIDRGQRAVVADLLTSLAKAALRNNDLKSCGDAITAGERFVKGWMKLTAPPELAGEARQAWSARLALAKIKIDYASVSSENGDLGHVLDDARRVLTGTFNFKPAWLRHLDSAGLSLKGRAVRGPDTTPSTTASLIPVRFQPFPTALKEVLDQFTALVGPQESENLSAWSDILGLMAELNVTSAEHRATGPEERLASVVKAYVMLTAADRLRRSAFETGPLKRDFHLNPHSTRVLVRAGLQLIKHGRRKNSGVPPETIDYLIAQTRRQLDILGRYVARFPTERPSLLILEAAFARQAGLHPHTDLIIAERLLSQADDLMKAAAHRPRVRLRLLRERAKVYRGLLEHEKDPRVVQAYVDLAYLEIWRLERLAHAANLELWKSIASVQRDKINSQIRKKGLSPSLELLKNQGA